MVRQTLKMKVLANTFHKYPPSIQIPKGSVRSKKGRPSLPGHLQTINLRHFAEMMERLTAYIESIEAATNAAFDQKADFESTQRHGAGY